MVRLIITLLLLAAGPPCPAQGSRPGFEWMETSPKKWIADGDLEIPVVDFKGLQPLLRQTDGKIRVVNFWATWCAPCIAELPYLEEAARQYASRGVEVVLVSLDFPAMWEKRLPSFVRKKQLQSPVVVLDDPDQNAWIPQVDPGWSGAIPATLIYSGDAKTFHETTFDRASLRSALEHFMK